MKTMLLGLSSVLCAGLLFGCDAGTSAEENDARGPGQGPDEGQTEDLGLLDLGRPADSGDEPPAPDATLDAGLEPTLFESRTLGYDDGRGRFLVPGTTPGNAVAVRFTAPAGTVLDEVYFQVSAEKVRILVNREIRRNEVPFRLRIAALGEDRAPGRAIFPRDGTPWPVAPKPLEGNGHLRVDLREHAIVVPGEFFVIMEWPMQVSRGSQALGFDASHPDMRTWLRLDRTWRPIAEVPHFGAMDAMIRAEVRAPAGLLPPPRVVLGNFDRECTSLGAAGPWADGGGLVTAARVKSPADGFLVGEIRIQLTHDASFGPPFNGTCNARTPFRIDLYRGDPEQGHQGPPAKVPEVLEHFDVTVRQPDGDPAHQLRLHPMTSIVLDKDETLFVAVHMERPDDAHVVCVQTCRAPATTGSDYWSSFTAPPYGWMPFEVMDVGGPSNLDVELEGQFMRP